MKRAAAVAGASGGGCESGQQQWAGMRSATMAPPREVRPVVTVGAANRGGGGSGQRWRALADVEAAVSDKKSGRRRRRRSPPVDLDGGGGRGGRVRWRLRERPTTMGRDAVGNNDTPLVSAAGVDGGCGQ